MTNHDGLSQLVNWISTTFRPDTPEVWVFFGVVIVFLVIIARFLYEVPNPKGRKLDDFQYFMPAIGEYFEGPTFEYADPKDKINLEALRQLEEPGVDRVVSDLEEHPDDYYFYIVKPHRRKTSTLKNGWILMLTHYPIDERFLSTTSMLKAPWDLMRGRVNIRVSNQASKEGFVVREPPRSVRIYGRALGAVVYYPHIVDDDFHRTKVMDVAQARALLDIAAGMQVFAKAETEKRVSKKEAEAERRHSGRLERLIVLITGERNEARAQAIAKRYDQWTSMISGSTLSPYIAAFIPVLTSSFLFDMLRPAWIGAPNSLIIGLTGFLGLLAVAILDYSKRSRVG